MSAKERARERLIAKLWQIRLEMQWDGLTSLDEWLAVRKAAALTIDPQTAEVRWCYAFDLDPYGVGDLPEELQQVGRNYFARGPGSDVWVSFSDLTSETAMALWKEREKRAMAGEKT